MSKQPIIITKYDLANIIREAIDSPSGVNYNMYETVYGVMFALVFRKDFYNKGQIDIELTKKGNPFSFPDGCIVYNVDLKGFTIRMMRDYNQYKLTYVDCIGV